MVKISLLDFFKTGSFGPVTLGITRDQVKNLLGEPDNESLIPKKKRKPAFWVYGIFEFYCNDETDRVTMIYTDHLDWDARSKCVKIDFWKVRFGIEIDAVKRALDDSGIEYSLDHESYKCTDGKCVELRLPPVSDLDS